MCRPCSHFCVCLHIIERPEPPDKSTAAKNVGLVGIQLNAVRRAFLKGSSVPLVVKVCLVG